MSEYPYTIAVCHLNMAETVQESLESLLSASDDRFEILVVDDGSTDGSREILAQLEAEHDRVRVREGDNSTIAAARNDSIEHAAGDVILHQLDADDRYDGDLVDFTKIFEALEEDAERPVYLRGRNVHITRRQTLLEYPYRDVGYGEDLDLWRRLTAAQNVKMVWLAHQEINQPIGYERSVLEYMRVRYSTARVQLRTGISAWSYARGMLADLLPWGIDTRPWYGSLFHLFATPIAWMRTLGDGLPSNDELPEEYRNYHWYRCHIFSEVRTLPELVDAEEIRLSTDDLSEPEVFYNELPAPESVIP